MLSLVLIEDVCGAASPPVVKNGDKWKLSRVSKERETVITFATCDVHTLCVKVALILMALCMGIKGNSVQFFAPLWQISKCNHNLLRTRGV